MAFIIGNFKILNMEKNTSDIFPENDFPFCDLNYLRKALLRSYTNLAEWLGISIGLLLFSRS
jgi:hypothetical protein